MKTRHTFLNRLVCALAALTLVLPADAQVVSTNPVITSGSIATASKQGNGTKVQLSTGTTTTNNCVKFDANGNTVDAGAACGGGSVSVTAGTSDIVITPSPGTGTFTVGTTVPQNTVSTSTYTILSTDATKVLLRTYTGGAMADTLPNAATSGFGANAQYSLCAASTQKDVVSVTSPSLFNGASSFTVPANSCVSFTSNGTDYFAIGLPPLSVGNTIVGSGTTDQIIYNNGGLAGEITKANNGVLVTNGSGTPSISTTLPTGLALSTPASGNLSNATNLPLTTGVTGALPVANGGTACTVAAIGCVTAITGATGTPDSTTYLRGDGTWNTPSSIGGTGGGTLQYSVTGLSLTSGTYYAPVGGAYPPNATEANVNAKAPAASTVAHLQVLLDTNAPTGGMVVTFRDAGADKAVTCTVSAGTKSCADDTHSFNPAAADAVNWKIVVTNTYTGGITILATDGTSNVGVTSVATGTGLTGGTISTTGTISCVNTTSAVKGCAQVDNSTITASAGVITTANTTVGAATCTPGGSCAPRTSLGGGTSTGIAQASTRYITAVGGGGTAFTTETSVAILAAKTTTVRNLYCLTETAPASGQTATVTFRKNFASPASGLVCTITGTATTGSDTTNSVSLSPGDTFDIMVVTSATSGTMTNGMSWGFTFE